MNILVIGNGFDLAHGLPTKYWDFMMFISNFKLLDSKKKEDMRYVPNFKKLNESVQEYLLKDEMFYKDKRSDIWNEFNDLLSDNIWISYFEGKVNDYQNKGWIDFEYEISEIIKALEYFIQFNIHNIRTGMSDYKEQDSLKDKLVSEYLSKYRRLNKSEKIKESLNYSFYGENAEIIIKDINNDLNSLIRCLEIYLGEVVENIDISYKNTDIENLKIDKVLSFNYSNTYEKYDKKDGSIEYDYIHGKVCTSRNIEENNMVLGINEYLEGNEKNKKLDFIAFKKYFQRIYKKTGCDYKRWIEEMKENPRDKNWMYIFGHSLDVTDKDILKELILLPNMITTVFYHDSKAHAQYISNLVKIIGQDELIKKVHGSNRSIIFKKQKEMRKRDGKK